MEVNGIGMGSNIHHRAQRKVIPAVAAGANSQPAEVSIKNRASDNIGPSGINQRLISNPIPKKSGYYSVNINQRFL
jgi:hypothetical protein